MKSSREIDWINKFLAPPPLAGQRQQLVMRRSLPQAAMQRNLYAEALQFATERLKNPDVRRFFKARRRAKQSAFTAAVEMYIDFHCPFDPLNYRISSN